MAGSLSAQSLQAVRAALPGAGPIVAAVAVAATALLLVIAPLPGVALDLLLAASLGAAVGVLLVAVVTPDPARLTALPPVLVLASLARILLCLCVTRLLMSNAAAGGLVATLGNVAGQRDPIAGLGLLVVVAIVHLLMVTTGVGRMAEVAARFALDALPGKQMGLDTAVGSGHLSSGEAQAAVERLEAEANFYGAMDGAGRMMRGEAVAAVVIVTVTAIAGLGRAVYAGADLGAAAATFALLATGQGLVTLLPAVVMAAAAAVVVSRSAHGQPLVQQVRAQMLTSPWPLAAAAVALLALGMLPGVAKLPTLLGGGVLTAAAWAVQRRAGRAADTAEATAENADAPPRDDQLVVQLGMGLLELTDGPEGLMAALPAVRRWCIATLGFAPPSIVVRDSLQLGATDYAFVFRAGTLTRASVRPGRLLALAPDAGALPDLGPPAELADGRAGVWVTAEAAAEVAELGYALLAPGEVIATHLRTELRRRAGEIFDLEQAAALAGRLYAEHPALRAEAESAGLTVPLLRTVCAELLGAGIPLLDPLSVLEGAIEALPAASDPEQLALSIRPRMAGMISDHLAVDGVIRAVLLAPELEDELAESAHREGRHTVAALMPSRAAGWVDLLDQVGAEHGRGRPLALIARADCLLPLIALCRQSRAWLVPVTAAELSPRAEVEHVARLAAEQLEP